MESLPQLNFTFQGAISSFFDWAMTEWICEEPGMFLGEKPASKTLLEPHAILMACHPIAVDSFKYFLIYNIIACLWLYIKSNSDCIFIVLLLSFTFILRNKNNISNLFWSLDTFHIFISTYSHHYNIIFDMINGRLNIVNYY